MATARSSRADELLAMHLLLLLMFATRVTVEPKDCVVKRLSDCRITSTGNISCAKVVLECRKFAVK
jgi:hypothetical protein